MIYNTIPWYTILYCTILYIWYINIIYSTILYYEYPVQNYLLADCSLMGNAALVSRYSVYHRITLSMNTKNIDFHSTFWLLKPWRKYQCNFFNMEFHILFDCHRDRIALLIPPVIQPYNDRKEISNTHRTHLCSKRCNSM